MPEVDQNRLPMLALPTLPARNRNRVRSIVHLTVSRSKIELGLVAGGDR